MPGRDFTCELLVDLIFERHWVTTTYTTEFMPLGQQRSQSLFLLGNAHIIPLPDHAEPLSFREEVKEKASGKIQRYDSVELPPIHRSPSGGQEALLFPRTRILDERVETFSLIFSFRAKYEAHPAKRTFEIPWKLDFSPRRYLGNLFPDRGMGAEMLALGGVHLRLDAPSPRWEWAMKAEELESQLLRPDNTGAALDQTARRYSQFNPAQMLFRLLNPEGRDIHLNLTLPAARSSEQAAENQRLQQEVSEQENRDRLEDLILFVADLRGSSAVEGSQATLSLQTQLFRAHWINADDSLFRQVKLVGDLVSIVMSPDQYHSGGGRRLCDHVQALQRRGMVFRGGLHWGRGVSTDQPRRGTLHRGEEFNGEVINHGSKVGDFKANDGGLLATEAFLCWLKGTDHGRRAWRAGESFGDWVSNLYRIEPRDLIPAPAVLPQTSRPRHFADRLLARAKEVGSHLIVGLDPDLRAFPEALVQRYDAQAATEALEEILVAFNAAVIEGTAPFAAGYKPQAAFYEQYGLAGMRALERTIGLLRERDLPIILDAKRNDIAHTAGAYGQAWLAARESLTGAENPWRVDALTINGYLGRDGVDPFLQADPHAGLFVLAKTSNPSAGEFQDLELSEAKEPVFEKMARLAEEWGAQTLGESGYSRIGLVVGATQADASRRLRQVAPRSLFLMPGVGAQGAGVETIAQGCDAAGWGAFAASSRGVLYAYKGQDYQGDGRLADPRLWQEAVAEAAGKEADKTRRAILQVIEGRK